MPTKTKKPVKKGMLVAVSKAPPSKGLIKKFHKLDRNLTATMPPPRISTQVTGTSRLGGKQPNKITKQIPPSKPEVPKGPSIEERLKVQESDIFIIKAGLNSINQSVVNLTLSEAQKFGELKQNLEQHNKYLSYIEDFASKPNLENGPSGVIATGRTNYNPKQDRDGLTYAYKLKEKFGEYDMPLSKEDIKKISEDFAKSYGTKAIGVIASWLVYLIVEAGFVAYQNLFGALVFGVFGLALASIASFGIWKK